MINPDDVTPDKNGHFPPEVSDNVPHTLQILALTYSLIGGVALLMFLPKQQTEDKKSIVSDTESLVSELS